MRDAETVERGWECMAYNLCFPDNKPFPPECYAIERYADEHYTYRQSCPWHAYQCQKGMEPPWQAGKQKEVYAKAECPLEHDTGKHHDYEGCNDAKGYPV